MSAGRSREGETGSAEPQRDGDDTGVLPHPELVQLALRRPTLGARVRDRIASRGIAMPAIADRVGRFGREGRVVCECEDVLAAEITRALESGARSLAQVVARTGLGSGICGGSRCLDAVALRIARECGRPASELRAEVFALVPASRAMGPDRGMARVALAYARLVDDAFDDDGVGDDEPELVVEEPRTRGRRRV